MKIAIIGTAWPYRGGLAAFNERMAAEFVKEGHQVFVYTFTLQYPQFLFPGKTQFSSVTTPPEGLEIIRCINAMNPLNWISVGRKIRREGFDLAVFCYWMSFVAPCFGSIARFIGKRTKRIALVHNMIPHEKSLLDKFLPPYFVRSMDGFVAMSKSVLKDIKSIEKKTKHPKAYSPHPLYDHFGKLHPREQALDKLGLDKDYRYILFFGLVRAYKGLDLLLEAFAYERLHGYPVKLLVVGEFYESPEKYFQFIAKNKLSDRVVVRNEYVADEEVSNWFSAADIIVQPYKTATQSGISQIAYHFEKPMLVTNVGGLAEIVTNGISGYVVPPQAKEITESLVDFFYNNRKAQMEQGVREEKKRFLWSGMTATILNLL